MMQKVGIIFLMTFTLCMMKEIVVFDFNKNSTLDNWQIVNDGVMGGKSSSELILTKNGHGQFSGNISLANYGGFASVNLSTNIDLIGSEKIILKIKGDGLTYQCRIKKSNTQIETYVHSFKTNGEWQEIVLSISDFKPRYRGQELKMPNFKFTSIQQLGFLIGNKKEGEFRLWIDNIKIK